MKIVNKTIDKSNELKESVVEGLAEVMTDDREYLVDSSRHNSQIELLKSYEPGTLSNKIPTSFYSYFGFRDWYRYPLIYPYSINCIDVADFGQIYDERNAVDITYDDKGVNQLQVYGITKFAFDKNYLIAKLSSQFDTEERGYVIFKFSSQEYEQFNNYSELMKKANEYGYEGSDLITIKEYDKLFFKSP